MYLIDIQSFIQAEAFVAAVQSTLINSCLIFR